MHYMKRRWKARAIFSFIITLMGLGGWARQYDVSIDTYIPIAIVWVIIVYSLSGLFFKEKKPNSKNISTNKINIPTPKPPTSNLPSPKPIEEKPLNVSNENTSVNNMFKNEDTTEEEVVITEQERQELWNQIEITPQEEEKLYEEVSKEVENNRKEGIWTKALVESDGVENKTKLRYIKLRVETLAKETKEKKFEDEIANLIKQKKKNIKFTKIILEEKDRIRRLESIELDTNNNLVDLLNVSNTILKENKKVGWIKSFFSEEDEFTVNIYRLNSKHSLGQKDRYYWLKEEKTKDVAIRSFFNSPENVKKDIEKYFDEIWKKMNKLV